MRNVTLLMLLAWSCVTAHGQQEPCFRVSNAVPLCGILSKAAEYDGNQIIVRGIYRHYPHGSVLLSPECPQQKKEVSVRSAPRLIGSKKDLKALRKLTQIQKPVDVVFKGIFKMAQAGHCFGQNCDPYEIEVSELLCVQPQRDLPGSTVN